MDAPYRVEAGNRSPYSIVHSGTGWFGHVDDLAEAFRVVDLLNRAERQRKTPAGGDDPAGVRSRARPAPLP